MTLVKTNARRSTAHPLERMSKADLLEQHLTLIANYGLIQENLAELELALDDEGWRNMAFENDREFSTGGLQRVINLCRLMYVKNPLVGRAVGLQRLYVFARGVELEARDDKVNDQVQAFLNDDANEAEFWGHSARAAKEVTLATEANIFFAFFGPGKDGSVRVRTFPVDDFLGGDIIRNPDDRREVWWYKRRWRKTEFDEAAEAKRGHDLVPGLALSTDEGQGSGDDRL
jgi:hypothetical protein